MRVNPPISRLLAVVLLVAAVIVAIGGAPRARASTGRNGLIVFAGPGKARGDAWDLYLAHGDGSHVSDLTPGKGMWEVAPTWFVEGDRVLFVAGRRGQPGDLWEEFKSGRGRNDLSRTPDAYEATPAYSTGGGRIAYARGPWSHGRPGSSDIWIMTWAGSDAENLTRNASSRVSNRNPVWSPDQNLLAYVHSVAGIPQIRLMTPGGLHIRNVVNVGVVQGQEPAWSSNRAGSSFTLAYVHGGDVYQVHIPTKLPITAGKLHVQPVRLTSHPRGRPDGNPAFSPDGTKILFQRGHTVMVMPSRPGSSPHALLAHTGSNPDWEPVCSKVGRPGGSTMVGTPGADLLCGGPGNDTIYGMGGDDVIFGGKGTDRIFAGYGNDFVMGGVGAGADALHGGPGNDYLDGGLGNNVLWGEGGNDRLLGGGGTDHIYGGPGNDTMVGGTGTDVLNGGDGNDLVNVFDHRSGDDSNGSSGMDTCFTDSGDRRQGCELPHG
ncbi:MAG TPA: hypothetical protein VID47_16745 [Actinomycetota bacterium]|jgi:Tol biopolymer transport system component